MKRPLYLVCIALAAILVLAGNAGDPKADPPAFYGEKLLLEAAQQRNILTFKGCVQECSTVSEGRRLSLSHLSVLNKDDSELILLSELKVIVTTEDRTIMPGDCLTVTGMFQVYQEARNPGNFDAKAYYRKDNIIGRIRSPKIQAVEAGRMDLPRILFMVRDAMRVSYERILDEKSGRIMSAICLGEKSNMETEWKNTYQEGGISHILAVSGLHVTMVGMTLFRILRWICIPYTASAVLAGSISMCYVMLTGSGISALRALLMFWISLGAQVCGRKYDIRTSIAVSALLLIWNDSSCIKEASFCLSFGAVMVIAVLLPCIQNTCAIQNKTAGALLGSAGIFLGTLPVTLYFFYQAVPWSILVNIAAVALMAPLMGIGLAAGAVGLFAQEAGIFLAGPVQWILRFFEWLCSLEKKLPGAVWTAGKPAAERMVLYYLLLIFGGLTAQYWSRAGTKEEKIYKIWRIRILWCIVFALGAGLMCPSPKQQLRILCLDVGQGDCSLVMLPDGTNCLIDGGSSSQKEIWEYRISDTVRYYGADTLEYVFLSHADSDHTSGILELLQEYRVGPDGRNAHGITVGHLVIPPTADTEDFRELRILAKEKNITVLTMEEMDQILTEDWSITCLAPDRDSLSGEKNQDSMVLMLQYQKFRMLFTGDLEGNAERELVKKSEEAVKNRKENVLCGRNGRTEETSLQIQDGEYQPSVLDADVLKVGHHGSKNASSEKFLSAVTPQMAVISCGADNTYGHPARETVERLEAAGARIMNTAQTGAVEIRTDGAYMEVKGYVSENG